MIDALMSVATRQPWLCMLPGIWIGSRSQLVKSSWLEVDIAESRESPLGGMKDGIRDGHDAIELDSRSLLEYDQKLAPVVRRTGLQREVARAVDLTEPD